MAELHGGLADATRNIMDWYHDMRVDHLEVDELLCEVSMRNIIIREDPTYSRRRRYLRDFLKVEREEKKNIEVKITGSLKEEATKCEQKFKEICDLVKQKDTVVKARCKTRLLHYGHRVFQILNHELGQEDAKFCNSLLVEIVDVLAKNFYTKPSNSANILSEVDHGEQIDNAQALNDLFTVNQEPLIPIVTLSNIEGTASSSNTQQLLHPHPTAPQQQFNRISSLCAEDKAWIISLQARIRELETELMDKINLNPTTAASVPGNSRPINQLPQTNRSNLNPNTAQRSTITTNQLPRSLIDPAQNFQPNSNENIPQPQSSSRYSPKIPPVSSSNFQPNQTYCSHFGCNHNPLNNLHQSNYTQPQPQIPYLPPYSNYQLPHPSQTYQQPIPSFQFSPCHSVHSGRPHTNSSRHTLPVSQWKITKYDGTDQGLKLNEFLEIVQTLSLAEHVSEVELFESAVHLFMGPALKWYMTMRTTGRLLNWQHLVLELKRTFMHPDMDALIKMKIYQRRQQRHESFHEFYYEMERLFRTMSS